MNLYLCGFQGVGKTHFGKLVAASLQRHFFDVDEELLVDSHFKTPREQYLSIGEIQFRTLEEEVIEKLTKKTASVIALGGGSLISQKNQTAIVESEGMLIYLYRPLEELQKKIEANFPPFLQSQESVQEFLLKRHQTFSLLSHATIALHELTEEAITQRISHYGK